MLDDAPPHINRRVEAFAKTAFCRCTYCADDLPQFSNSRAPSPSTDIPLPLLVEEYPTGQHLPSKASKSADLKDSIQHHVFDFLADIPIIR
ncbi:hypothetical protein TNCV_2612811 [Trichonephila clavipes]|nr:hypothetical protein TNCV_2612811 [Trichonephila clavipes]